MSISLSSASRKSTHLAKVHLAHPLRDDNRILEGLPRHKGTHKPTSERVSRAVGIDNLLWCDLQHGVLLQFALGSLDHERRVRALRDDHRHGLRGRGRRQSREGRLEVLEGGRRGKEGFTECRSFVFIAYYDRDVGQDGCDLVLEEHRQEGRGKVEEHRLYVH